MVLHLNNEFEPGYYLYLNLEMGYVFGEQFLLIPFVSYDINLINSLFSDEYTLSTGEKVNVEANQKGVLNVGIRFGIRPSISKKNNAKFLGNEKNMVKKKLYNLYLVIIILILTAPMTFSQGKSGDKQRGVGIIEKNTSQSKGRKCALIIGINEYKERSTLKNPVPDARAVEGILLNKFGYKPEDMTILYDKEATWKNIDEKLKDYLGEDGLQEDDTLFVFFSGHGWSDNLDMYWLPVDFGIDLKNGENNNESQRKIPMSQIQAFLTRCKAKHIFVVADSCFAGKYFSISDRTANDAKSADRKSRQSQAHSSICMECLWGAGTDRAFRGCMREAGIRVHNENAGVLGNYRSRRELGG